ncbi:hypothetical protein chiPu_0001379 [Chiloscyllium punctatum]|uniref:Uncharacterized protein n=1 Tax=Chiloscyllium punctatum TaxID=137246 RepID=A0A401RY25_CHIPU|nr:hypothetical protein [Chiloscyllium punctatum]
MRRVPFPIHESTGDRSDSRISGDEACTVCVELWTVPYAPDRCCPRPHPHAHPRGGSALRSSLSDARPRDDVLARGTRQFGFSWSASRCGSNGCVGASERAAARNPGPVSHLDPFPLSPPPRPQWPACPRAAAAVP